MHADIAQPLHSTQGRFSFILHSSPSIVFLIFFTIAFSFNLTFRGCLCHKCWFFLPSVFTGLTFHLCSLPYKYNKDHNRVDLPLEGAAACLVSRQLTSNVDFKAVLLLTCCIFFLVLQNMSVWCHSKWKTNSKQDDRMCLFLCWLVSIPALVASIILSKLPVYHSRHVRWSQCAGAQEGIVGWFFLKTKA